MMKIKLEKAKSLVKVKRKLYAITMWKNCAAAT